MSVFKYEKRENRKEIKDFEKTDEKELLEKRKLKNLSKFRTISLVIGRLIRIRKEIKTFGSRVSRDYPLRGRNKNPTFKQVLLFYPKSKFKLIWNLVIFFCVFYTATVLPYRVCFNLLQDSTWQTVDLIVDSIFMTDILISFNTALVSVSEKITESRKEIAISYIKGWFLIDLISSLPLDYLMNMTSYNKFLRFMRVYRVYKIVKILRLLKLFRLNNLHFFEVLHIDSKLNSTLSRIITFIFCVILFVHISGCLWYYIANIDDGDFNNWIHDQNISNFSDFDSYLASIYFVFTTFTTIGYGDIHPINNAEKVFSIVMITFGVSIYSYLIGALSSTIISNDHAASLLKAKKNCLKDFANATKLPKDIKNKVKNHLTMNIHKFYLNSQFWSVFKDMPYNLKEEIMSHNNKKIAERQEFFRDKPFRFINNFVEYMKLCYFSSNDTIFEEDDIPEEVYFIKSGKVALKIDESIVFWTYLKGHYFGEIEVVEDVGRICTAMVYTKSAEIYVINKKDFTSILESYEEIYSDFKALTSRRKIHLEEMIITAIENRYKKSTSQITDCLNEYESSESIDTSREALIRNDTVLKMSFQNNTPYKKKNRLIWEKANGHCRFTGRKNTKTKSYIEKHLKSLVQSNPKPSPEKCQKRMVMMKNVPKISEQDSVELLESSESISDVQELGIKPTCNFYDFRITCENLLNGIKKSEKNIEKQVDSTYEVFEKISKHNKIISNFLVTLKRSPIS